MSFSQDRYLKALSFAARAHGEQKTPIGLPYIVHVSSVAMVKLADRITNLAPPPPQWTAEKISAYRAEAVLIADTLGAASALLAARLRQRIERYGR